jgi:UPF0755 protein
MSNLDILGGSSPAPEDSQKKNSGRRSEKPMNRFLPLIVMLVLVLGLAGVFTPKIVGALRGAPDFPGPGSGSVQFEVVSGQTIAQIGNALKAQGVVKSVDSFTAAAANNSKSNGIQPGFYNLKLEMKSADAIAALLNSDFRITNKVVIPEGLRASAIFEIAAKATGIAVADFEAASKDQSALGLPNYAQGNVEGFLFPATYDFAPNATAISILKTMVDKHNQEIAKLDVYAKAKALGLTPYQVITVASLLQVEGHPRDFAKVARVVYNRLDAPMRLQMDSAVNYGLGKTDVIITTDLLAKDTPYNVYLHDGLPPTPIDNPGAQAIAAALNPASGNWLYFITTDLGTQETKFTADYQEFLRFKDEFLAYCDTHEGAC